MLRSGLFVVGLLALLVVGCRPDPAMHLGMTTPSPAAAAAAATEAPILSPKRKVLSDKILTAIALERVTGRQPDPRRFIETR